MGARVFATIFAAAVVACLIPAPSPARAGTHAGTQAGTHAGTRAGAWQESHPSGDDVRVRIEADGTASVEHSIRWRVVRGPLEFVDVSNVDPVAVLDPAVSIASDDGRTLSGHASRREGRDATIVRVVVDDPRAAQRGSFTFDVRWRIDLVAAGGLTRDGSTWRLALAEPPAVEGYDQSRTVIDLPSAPDAPAPIAAETGALDDTVLSSLRRGADRDVLELMRPHVARGESVRWTVRVDGRALALRPPAAPGAAEDASSDRSRIRPAGLAALLAAVGLAFGSLLRRSAAMLSLRMASRRIGLRGLVPIPLRVRAFAGGGAFASGVGCEMAGHLAAGGLFVALATLLAAWRPGAVRPTPRGPGRWLVLRPDDAFAACARSSGDWLDVRTAQGRAAAAGLAAAAALLGLVARRAGPEWPWLLAMDAAPFVPFFLAARSVASAAGDPAGAARWLARAYTRLRAVDGVRVVPWARIVQDGSVDELRLLVLPRAPVAGVVGIELGVAWTRTPLGLAASPEILARVLEPSAAWGRLLAWDPSPRSAAGRRRGERVLLAIPPAPSCKASVELVRTLARRLSDGGAPPAQSAGSEAPWPAPAADPHPRPVELASGAGPGLC